MKRSKHNLSNYHLTTCDPGQLIPIGCVPALPGDTFQHHTNCVVRMSPMLAPIMHPLTARIHHFFVPNRKIWNKGDDANGTWEDFITGGPDGDNADAPPTITTTGTAKDMLDYLGIPLVAGIDVNAMPVRAVNLCFNEYYRDQDLVPVRDLDDLTIPKIAWEKDYFTSARPWTQKGPDITLPLGQNAPVKGIGIEFNSTWGSVDQVVRETGESTNSVFANANEFSLGATPNQSWMEEDPNNPGYPGIYADLASATGADVNDIRRAFAMQRYQEARARYGSRYTEYLRYLGVTPADSRLQRPEYLGGGHTQLQISEVLQTGVTTTGTDGDGVGTMNGHGISAMRSNKYRRFIEEHGYIVTMFSCRPKSIYLDQIQREWLRTTKEDYFQKELQHIGQQEVYNNEVYADPTNGMDVFGYNDRYMDYREYPSRISADFRSTLDFWHMGRAFGAAPTLNASFVECSPSKRVFADQTDHVLWIMNQHKMVARRLVSRNASARIF